MFQDSQSSQLVLMGIALLVIYVLVVLYDLTLAIATAPLTLVPGGYPAHGAHGEERSALVQVSRH